MKSARLQLGPLVLVLILAVWVAGLFVVSPVAWLLPYASGVAEELSGPVVVPGSGDRPGRLSLARVDLADDRGSLLTIRVGSSEGFGLQVKDRSTGEVAEVFRFPQTDETTDHLLALDPRVLPKKLRLTVWNRHRVDLEIESVSLRSLRLTYRWAPILYKLVGPLLLLGAMVRARHRLRAYLRSDPLSVSAPRPRWDHLVTALIFLFCFSIFRWAPVHQVLDAKFISVVSHSLVETGSLALPQDFSPAKRARQIYTLRPVGERTYHFFSSAPAVLNAPFVAVFEWAGISPVREDGRYLGHHEAKILRFIAAFLAAALCAVLFLIARIWLPPGNAIGVTLLFALGSQVFSTVSRPFWSHSWTTLLLALALLLLVTPRVHEKPWAYVLISTLLCWAYFCRPPMSLAIIGTTGYVFWVRRRFVVPFVGAGLVWAGLFAWYSTYTYGSWLPPYFLASHLKSGRLAGGLLLSSYPEALFGTLISPGRGLFVYLPFLLLVLLVVSRRWRWLPDRALAILALSVCFAHWQVVSLFRNWWGGQSFGPRLMSDLLPWLFLLTVFALVALQSAAAEGVFRWTPAKVSIVGLLVAVSIFIHFRGATVQETQRGAGIWNWRYPQFMAGLIPRPETEQGLQIDE